MELRTSFHKGFPGNRKFSGSQVLRRKNDGKLEVEVEGFLDMNERYKVQR
jgi:hypothetical protein